MDLFVVPIIGFDLETYHSGSLSFVCAAVGWQISSGMASNPMCRPAPRRFAVRHFGSLRLRRHPGRAERPVNGREH
jgi:hypothetical protein